MRVIKDLRMRVAVMVILTTLMVALLIRGEITPSTAKVEMERVTLDETEKHPIHELFLNAVGLLHTRQFEPAARSFSKLTELAPWMPEAEVNLAFALMGLGQYAEAQRHFHRALELNDRQLNAYYGLAISMEHQGDLASALGAMRVYVHLASDDDPHRRKAWAAIWEWQDLSDNGEKVIE
ncbi:MAG: tetratricopeptide repeat protein [Candidatus Thiodiazotropha taylori]|nr:tetratricopeptide repeat protein [Candidatus Thiodiazotropha endolucinida]MCG8071580.1 tetratricopeptide repeat protein [Candidatus Thiodiazotropha taylori]MCG8085557.1 tetratricopeptide repeat protein [Candidatus Thiodiazotropha taylori]MCG8095900.1 tetratricopeptide repeat protein [Candidatus Thiodiazotropha endolucinida]MCW4227871.1 tetratricopeptide repeat protein [Candidatus Thiodiazotropha taylori]